MPQPQHLYHEIDVTDTVARWEEMQAGMIFMANHPVYLVQNYCGLAQQNDYHEWLFKQAEFRAEPGELLANFIDADQLPLDKVEARVSSYIFDQVEHYLD